MLDQGAEIGENLRHYSSARFTRLNESLIANAALLGAMQIDAIGGARVWIPAFGILITGAFWAMCERTASYYWAFRLYAETNEKIAGGGMYSSLPKRPRILNTSVAIRTLFGALLAMWAVLELGSIR